MGAHGLEVATEAKNPQRAEAHSIVALAGKASQYSDSWRAERSAGLTLPPP